MASTDLTYAVLGAPGDDPTLRLDHERFAYAGKFVMTTTGKAVARRNGDVVGAVAFNRDRTDAAVAWLRYLTVRKDHQGEGIGARLALYTAEYATQRGADRVRIAVNNPYAFVACYRAGFRYADRETGLAEVVLERPAHASVPSPARREEGFCDGLKTLLGASDRPEGHHAFAERYLTQGPPESIDPESLEVDGETADVDGDAADVDGDTVGSAPESADTIGPHD